MSATYRSVRDLPEEEYIAAGTPMCAGCGGLECLRLFHKILGDRLIFINAAGCMTLLATFPLTPFHGSWLYTTMGSAAAGAQGVRDALDILIEKKRIPPDEDMKVVVLAGEGSTMDIGLASESGTLHRKLDFYYLCYDNEGYGNTGFQMSSGSPYGSHTHTSDPGPAHPEGAWQDKKDIFEIWRAHRPAYIATLSPRHPVDLANKISRSMTVKGSRLFLALAPCPPAWGFDPAQTHQIARAAVDTGIWPLKEALDGEVRHTHIPPMKRVETFLETQSRYRHLFEPSRNDAAIARIQKQVDAYWQAVRRAESVK
jgi:pyruvate ferredoxin oxidoreductase beta subunit